jgi:DNA-binding transcriptional LysR family regulator
MDFDLRLLRHCRALAEEGSFAKAARALHLTQPALSRSIRDLEERVGIRIFDRTRVRVVPTDLGRAFLDRAAELLAHAEALEREVAHLKGSGSGALKVGAGTFPSVLFMGTAMAEFVARHPAVAVQVRADHWANLVALLRRRELDVVVGQPPEAADAADLDVVPLTVRQGHFFVRRGHPLLARAAHTLADIVAYPLAITNRTGAALADVLGKARSGAQPRRATPDFGCESFAILRAVTRRTDHVMIATPGIVAEDLAAGDLVALPLVDPRICSPFAVMRLRGRTLPPVADALVAAIVEADRATLSDRAIPPPRAATHARHQPLRAT